MEPYQHDLLRYFEEAAEHYSADIEPVFSPLVSLLVTASPLEPGDRILDLGTGNGIAARHAARQGCRVAALDFSHLMTVAASGRSTPGVLQGDFHRLPFAYATFEHVLAAFALNSAMPQTAMLEARRVLKPGGRLALQEWGTVDPVSNLLGDILMEYAVEEPPDELAHKRREQQALHPWDEMETSDDIVRLMELAGFDAVDVKIRTASIMIDSAAAFIRYKLAWPIRRAEIDAMPEEIRQLCLSDLQENIDQWTEANGKLHWQPNVVQVFGTKSAS